MKKTILPLTLALCCVLFCLSACGAPAPASEALPEPASSTAAEAAPEAAPASAPATLDESIAIRAWVALQGGTAEDVERLKTESTWEFVSDSDSTGHLIMARGGTIQYILNGSTLTAIDSGSFGTISRVSVLDLTDDSVVFDEHTVDATPVETGLMDETLAREIFIAAYGSSNEEIDTMQTESTWNFVSDSDSAGHLEIARGGSIEFLRNGDITTMIDYGTFGPSRVVKYNTATHEIVSDIADEG